jgi:hypothetical protein
MIVSLTTIPKRIKHIHLVIQSLKRQTKKPTKILLWIPHLFKNKEEYIIPEFLKNEKLVEIIRCDDLGPATKFIHTIKYLKKNKDFIVVDDDTIYSQYLIEDLTALPNLYGAKCIKGTAFDEWNQKSIKSRDPDYINRQRKSIRVTTVPNKFKNREKLDNYNCINIRKVPIICGCDGMLLNTSFFNNDIYNVQERFFHCDDIWLSGYLAANNIDKYVVPCREIQYDKSTNKWKDIPDDCAGGTIQFYLNTNKTTIFKEGQMPHTRYLSDYGKIDGGKYETIKNYKTAINYFKK